MAVGRLQVFALGASRGFGDAVAQTLGIALAPHEEREFEDGEHKARPLDGVRGDDVHVIHSLYGDASQSVNDKLLRLMFFLGALKDAGAARVTAIVPYLAYSRKDQRTKPRDPVTTRYLAAMFEAVGTDAVVSMDVHNVAAFQNAFRCRSEHLEAAPLLVRALLPQLHGREPVVVSPDAGGIKRADALRRRLETALGQPIGAAFAEKYRSDGELRGDMLVGDVAGKACVIVDDMICAGSTMARAARACREHGATAVIAAASHGVFAPEANGILAAARLDRMLVTDSVAPWRLTDPQVTAVHQTIETTAFVAAAIARLHDGGSLADLNRDGPPA